MRFLCDAMLGDLARDLRALGHDTTLAGEEDDAVLVTRAAAEERLLVTRDKGLARHGIVLSEADALTELAARVDLRASAFLSLCLACNVPLAPHDGSGAPDGARPPFTQCPSCGRTYWRGTHVEALQARLAPYL